MKKYLSMFLALALMLMLLFCTACSSSDSGNTDPSDDPSETVSEDVSDNGNEDESSEGVESPILIDEEIGEGFACVLLDNGEVYWQKGITSPTTIRTMNDLKGPPMADIYIVAVGDELQIQIVGDEIPDWYLEEQEEMEAALFEAYAEWEAAEDVEVVDIGPVSIEAESTEGGRMFACVLTESGDIYWEVDVTQPSELVTANSLEGSYAEIQVVHMPGDIWQMQVVGEVPDWLANDADMQAIVWNAVNQWKDAT